MKRDRLGRSGFVVSDVRWVRGWIISLLLLLWAATAESAEPKGTFSLYIENDLFSETDQDYTSGLQFSWVSPDMQSFFEDEELPPWLESVNNRLRFFHGSKKDDVSDELDRNVSVTLGQQIYTPEDLTRTDLIEDDRPYAGWLYLGFGYHTRQLAEPDRPGVLDTLEVQLGVVGPAARGQEAQDFIHDLRGFEKFLGWDNQLENELGLVATWEHRRKLKEIIDESRFGYDLIGHAGVSIGNVRTQVNAGGELRAGWGIPDDFGTSSIRPAGENSAPMTRWDLRLRDDRQWSFHGFVSVNLKLVGHDIFLDGNIFRDSHSVSKETFVAEAAVGVAWMHRGFRISYAHIFRSKEFSQQGSSHSYGSLSLSYHVKQDR